MRIKISPGNIKMGRVPSISLPPILSCRPDAPCTTDCYAMKAWRLYPGTRKAWQSNLDFYREHPREYFRELRDWLLKKKPERFRFHVGGEIYDMGYLMSMDVTARICSDTQFLVFTKQYGWASEYFDSDFAPNLTVILSAWPGLPLVNPHGLPVAWMDNGNDERIPADAERCPGKCDTCSACWGRKNDVVFNKH